MSRFLTAADVERLTGYVMASYQLKYCRNNGIQAWMNARGEVVVPITAVEGRAPAENDADWRPDFAALEKRA